MKAKDGLLASCQRLLGVRKRIVSLKRERPATPVDWKVVCGDARDVLASMAESSVDAVVCDPPYEIGIMGKGWDASGIAYSVPLWREVLRVLKPGGHLLAFGGSRTYHRMACAIEDAGFEIRDSIDWIYGCLSDDTEILTSDGWVNINTANTSNLVACYNLESQSFQWGQVEQVFRYEIDDTVFRVRGDRTDQIITRDHRCVVERGGKQVFERAEEAAQELETRLPVLENVRGLLDALPVLESGAGGSKQNMWPGVCKEAAGGATRGNATGGTQENGACPVFGMREAGVEAHGVAAWREEPNLLPRVQREVALRRTCEAPAQGARGVDSRVCGIIPVEDDRREQSGVEGWSDACTSARELRVHQVRTMPARVPADGPQGRVCDGAPSACGASDGEVPQAVGGCSPRGPQPHQQRLSQPVTLRVEPSAQTVRGARFTSTDLVRFEPIHYRGLVWCVKVATGAFVARRNGKAFVTGNSGFPKSLDVSKAIDEALWAEREVVGLHPHPATPSPGTFNQSYGVAAITAPATPEAKQWQGWGTALKPAHEPIVVARKPLSGTIAANVLAHGTGGLNVDACRVATDWSDRPESWKRSGHSAKPDACKIAAPPGNGITCHDAGRWPPNVVLTHAPECTETACVDGCPVLEMGEQSGTLHARGNTTAKTHDMHPLSFLSGCSHSYERGNPGDTGTAARFFPCFRYEAKVSTAEREAGCESFERACKVGNTDATTSLGGRLSGTVTPRHNNHPTVKPITLMRWLVRLVTPPGGTVLDPFAGSGSTGCAAVLEGFGFIGIDLVEHHCEIARARIAHHEKER